MATTARVKPPRLEKCWVCKTEFTATSSFHVACKIECAVILAQRSRDKAYKRKTRELKRDFRAKDKQYWKSKAIEACHRYIRARDGDTCISCGDRSGRQIHAGHFQPTSVAPGKRFHWANINSQCARCNTYLGGAQAAYRVALAAKVGEKIVQDLEKYTPPVKFTLEDYQDITEWYNGLYDALKSP